MKSPEQINQLITDCITGLSGDQISDGVEQLQELAILYKSAGQSIEDWLAICEYIESEAIRLSDSDFIKYKINKALKERIIH